jgi:hypothetical protein
MRTTVTAILGALTLTLAAGTMIAPAFAGVFTTRGDATSSTKQATIDCGHTSNGWYNPVVGVCQFPSQ